MLIKKGMSCIVIFCKVNSIMFCLYTHRNVGKEQYHAWNTKFRIVATLGQEVKRTDSEQQQVTCV